MLYIMHIIHTYIISEDCTPKATLTFLIFTKIFFSILKVLLMTYSLKTA